MSRKPHTDWVKDIEQVNILEGAHQQNHIHDMPDDLRVLPHQTKWYRHHLNPLRREFAFKDLNMRSRATNFRGIETCCDKDFHAHRDV